MGKFKNIQIDLANKQRGYMFETVVKILKENGYKMKYVSTFEDFLNYLEVHNLIIENITDYDCVNGNYILVKIIRNGELLKAIKFYEKNRLNIKGKIVCDMSHEVIW